MFALKTNLLFDVALIPNFEIEIPIGRHWSVNGEYMFPWWLLDGDKYCLEIMAGGTRSTLLAAAIQTTEATRHTDGHFVGLYAGGGKYDLQWKTNGYQGEFFIAAGFSYGYAHKLSRHLHLEFNIGIGLLRTDYRHYHARNNYQTLQWQENGRYTWFGPTKAKVSLYGCLPAERKNTGRRHKMKHKYPASFPLLCIVFLHITFLACERRELTYYEVAEISLSADWSLSGLDSKEADFGASPCFIRKQAANRKYSFRATVRETITFAGRHIPCPSLNRSFNDFSNIHPVEKRVMKHWKPVPAK